MSEEEKKLVKDGINSYCSLQVNSDNLGHRVVKMRNTENAAVLNCVF